MSEDMDKVRRLSATGLTRAEAIAVLGRRMTPEELQEFDKVKAVEKLKTRLKKNDPPPMPPANEHIQSLKQRYTKKQIEEAIVKCDGRLAAVVRALDCSYRQLNVWLEHHRDHAELARKLRFALVDEAEDQIWQALHSSDPVVRQKTAEFILKTLGRERGWGEACQAVSVNVGGEGVDVKSIFF